MLPLSPRQTQDIFITSSEDEGLDILHRFGLAFVVELVEGCKEGGLLGKF